MTWPQIVSRVNEKRSIFGSRTLKVVDDFFKQSEYKWNAKKISDYTTWAISKYGPAVWKTPAPMTTKGPRGSDDFVVCVSLHCW
jgi:hypothetical protein